MLKYCSYHFLYLIWVHFLSYSGIVSTLWCRNIVQSVNSRVYFILFHLLVPESKLWLQDGTPWLLAGSRTDRGSYSSHLPTTDHWVMSNMWGSRGGKEVLDPLSGKSQKYRVSPDPLKNHKATIIGTPAKCHLYGVSLACGRWPASSGILILPPLINLKIKTKWQTLDPRMSNMIYKPHRLR